METDHSSEWSEGTELSYAYWSFAESRQREEVQQRPDIGATAALTELMYAALFAKLAGGELSAYGFRSEPNPSGHPVELPKYCFVQRPNISDSENDRVSSSGVHYDRVRISMSGDCVEEVRAKKDIVPRDIEIVDPNLVSTRWSKPPVFRRDRFSVNARRLIILSRKQNRPVGLKVLFSGEDDHAV